VNELQEKLKAALLAARAICDKADQEKRDFTADERQQLDGYLKEAATLKGAIKEREGDAELRKQLLAFGNGIELSQTPGERAIGRPGRGKSIGEQFVESEQYRNWLKAVAPGGQIPDGMRGFTSPAVEFSYLPGGRKDLITGVSDVSAGAFIAPDYTGIYEPLGRIPLVLRDLISQRQTTSDVVEFVRQTQQVQEAAPVQEANVKVVTGATGEISGTKPQGSLAWEKVTANVKTIAVYMAATRRALSDAAQIRGIIDQELRDDIAEELEDQMLNGDGVGENFTGVLNTAGILQQAFDTNIFTTTRQAITTLQVTGRSRPTAWLFNPSDWETVELAQDSVQRYYGNGPFAQGPNRLWGYPVVESQFVPTGHALLADWRKAILWDRQRTTIMVTDSHSDWFIRNIIAILAEMRAAFCLIRTTAFIDVLLA